MQTSTCPDLLINNGPALNIYVSWCRMQSPKLKKKISTRVPAFYYKDRYLLSYSASRRHLSLFVMQGDIIRHFAERLKGFDTGRRVIRFDSERPLPDALIRDIACFRKQQIDLQQ